MRTKNGKAHTRVGIITYGEDEKEQNKAEWKLGTST